MICHYRPHSERMGKVLFSQVSICPHFGGGGTPIQMTGGYPHLADRGYPHPGPLGGGGGTPSSFDGGKYHHPVPMGVTPSSPDRRVPPSGQLGGYPIQLTGFRYPRVPPIRTGWGYQPVESG